MQEKKQQQYFGSFPFGERSQPTPPITLRIVVWTSERQILLIWRAFQGFVNLRSLSLVLR